ncbi:MAG: biotin transporter BioY [Acidobacteria bacterium]|nr:biotin transporter BioY [Acidobacteriota bacterium]
MPTSRAAAAPFTTARPVAGLAGAGIAAGAMLFATALTGAASQASVTLPGMLIPFTLQPIAVLLSGAVLGARLGAGSQALYLLAGVVGASMFAWSPVLLPGAARLMGPTGGFLMAFPVAAFVAGVLSERGFTSRPLGAAVAMTAGAAALYAFGTAWAMATIPGTPLAAFAPYAAADLVKVLLVAPAVPALRRALLR